ncbi:MAG TPA: hypothetical protein DER01_17375 [Phycisphaerales bacterium]|nr:hypothetical protein [Phycisphaerales bacterium]|tara:strand:+ start:876 stop:1772 length:897 start_codon:yes stop_codon:yes gene_type:complete
MNETIVTFWLFVLVLLGTWCSFRKCRQILQKHTQDDRTAEYRLTDRLFILLAFGTAGVFLFRIFMVHQSWRPLTSHVDGLTLLVSLLCPTLIYLEKRGNARGVSFIGYPGVTFLLLWALCASRWTFRAFTPDTMMKVVHLFAVYMGTLAVFISALYGGTYLFSERRLKRKENLGQSKQFASLETLERMIVVSSAVGFTFISLGLVTGLVSISALHEKMPSGWWHSPKIILAFAVWVIYALLFNVRHTIFFRGSRAAWLSLLGLLLLIMTFGAVHTFSSQFPTSSPFDTPTKQSSEVDG